MAEYIKREEAINLLWLYADESCASVVSDFESLPAADVAEVRHGRWVVTDVIACSECQHFTRSEFAGRWNYCPNCGALMQEETNGEK